MKKVEKMSMNILKDHGKYYFFNSLTIEKILVPKTYLFNFDAFGNCWLEDMEGFKLPEKVYDVNSDLKLRVKQSFSTFKKNLGVLLTGNKGQGKSLTAKIICNEMNLPIIVINKQIPVSVNFVTFLNNIKQDYILFVDEFEKLFKEKQSNQDEKQDGYHKQEIFLSFMDGVLTNDTKILFLLTTNHKVNEFFINRPSRIKFLLEYEELAEELFNLITDDKLVNKEYREDLVNNVSLINMNIDLLISIIDDINLFNKPFSEFKNIYNYKPESYKYEVTIITNGVSKFDGFDNPKRKYKINDEYMYGYTVKERVKFTKDEIIFKAEDWINDASGKEVKQEMLIKLVPVKNYSHIEVAF